MRQNGAKLRFMSPGPCSSCQFRILFTLCCTGEGVLHITMAYQKCLITLSPCLPGASVRVETSSDSYRTCHSCYASV